MLYDDYNLFFARLFIFFIALEPRKGSTKLGQKFSNPFKKFSVGFS